MVLRTCTAVESMNVTAADGCGQRLLEVRAGADVDLAPDDEDVHFTFTLVRDRQDSATEGRERRRDAAALGPEPVHTHLRSDVAWGALSGVR